MSSAVDVEANRKLALNQLRFNKTKMQENNSHGPSASSSSAYLQGQQQHQQQSAPPAQSRDASHSSRYFPPPSSSVVYVPDSSPLASSSTASSAYRPYQLQSAQPPVLARSFYSHSTINGNWNKTVDPLSRPSGFITSPGVPVRRDAVPIPIPVARRDATPSRRPFEDGGVTDGPPRKRVNLGEHSPDSINLFADEDPASPDIMRPGQRRKMLGNAAYVGSPHSSEGSPSDTRSASDISSKPRIIRGVRQFEAPKPLEESPQLKGFKMLYPTENMQRVAAAFHQCKGDTKAAAALLDDPSFKAPVSPVIPLAQISSSPPETPSLTGRNKERDIEREAERAGMKEKAKQSLIYANRAKLAAASASTSSQIQTVSSSTVAQPARASPQPVSPAITRPGKRAAKRAVIDSDESDSDDTDMAGNKTQAKDEDYYETKALHSFNSHASDALRELTGCTPEQAEKIISLRPFSTVEDLEQKLGQRRKKAGPGGISPRLFQDVVDIYEGYGSVDNILEDCERIGAELKKAIAAWSPKAKSKSKGPTNTSNPPNALNGLNTAEDDASAVSRGGSVLDEDEDAEDGALNLHTLHVSGMSEKFLVKSPKLLADGVQLKDYQLLGVNWLNLLYTRKLSCILADEMGLGKTVQVISFFAYLKEQGCKGPHLIVVPSSTLENWCREFARFAPTIAVQTYYADKNERPYLRQTLLDTRRHKSMDGTGWEVLITTYNLANGDEKDRKFFRRVAWNTCVYDEGHVLKNFQSQRYTALMKIESIWKLLLTGTPLQNNLQELVSLMNFILPNRFEETMESLRAIFKVKGDSKVSLLAEGRVSRAKKMMTPFVLRRRKDQVLKDLPKKTERIEWCDMTVLQKTIYRDALQRSRKTIFDLEADEAAVNINGKPVTAPPPPVTKKGRAAATRNKEKVYLENSANVLMDLRKAANHPMLFRTRFTDDVLTSMTKLLLKEPDFKKRGAVFQFVKEDMQVMTDSELQAFCTTYQSIKKFAQADDCFVEAGKVKTMLQLLTEYRAQGRKCLVFSQFTQVLDILQVVLKHKHIKYLVLTGATAVDVRQALVDEFTEDESIDVFLLSTKAGGMGINLTAASVVIMFDQDFNPHNDRQAADRAYRIGQKRDVEIVKLITRGTIEEDMLRLGETKLALDEAVAGDGEDGEGKGESQQEKVIKTSLMQTLRKQLDHGPEGTPAPAEVVTVDVKMDVDDVPPKVEDVKKKKDVKAKTKDDKKTSKKKKNPPSKEVEGVVALDSSSELTELED